MLSIHGLSLMGIKLNPYEQAFNYWQCFQNPELVADGALKAYVDSLLVEQLGMIQRLKKRELLEYILEFHSAESIGT
jgi:hypothetical protein